MLKHAQAGSVEYGVYRNATIKGFELVLKTAGKLLRKHLKEIFPRPKEVITLYFKDVLRHATKHGLLEPEAATRWFTFRDSRNLTAHDYGEALADEALTQVQSLIDDAFALALSLEGSLYGGELSHPASLMRRYGMH